MGSNPTTRPSLLVRLRDSADREAWEEFVSLYGPLIYRYCRKRGLQDADAADMTQTVLQAVSVAVARLEYDRKLGTFRGLLFTIVRNQLNKWWDKQQRRGQTIGDSSVLNALTDSPEESAEWDREYKYQQFLWAADRVKTEFETTSWQAFWLTAVDGKSATETAETLQLSIGAVYTAKSRILKRIRAEIQQLGTE